MAELTWQVDAIDDLDQIAQFIARQSPDYAPIYVQKVISAAERLSDFSRLGRVIPELEDDELRELIFQNYRIVYWIREQGIVILGVVHSALDFGTVARRRRWYLA